MIAFLAEINSSVQHPLLSPGAWQWIFIGVASLFAVLLIWGLRR